jgi:exonuclease VII large subunit
MTLPTNEENLMEVAARSRRMETALFRISEHMGIEKQTGAVTVVSPREVKVRGFDITLSKIKQEMSRNDMLQVGTPVSVLKDGQEIAVVMFSGD